MCIRKRVYIILTWIYKLVVYRLRVWHLFNWYAFICSLVNENFLHVYFDNKGSILRSLYKTQNIDVRFGLMYHVSSLSSLNKSSISVHLIWSAVIFFDSVVCGMIVSLFPVKFFSSRDNVRHIGPMFAVPEPLLFPLIVPLYPETQIL